MVLLDINKPEDCNDSCPLAHYSISAGKDVCRYNRSMADCPIKPIGELIEKIDKAKKQNHTLEVEGLIGCYNAGLDYAIEIIKEYCEVNKNVADNG